MIVERITAPTSPPFDLAAVKAHLRVDFADDDGGIATLAAAAAAEIEARAGLVLIDQTVRVSWGMWPAQWCEAVPLPLAPLRDPSTVGMTASGEEFAGFTVSTGLRPAITVTGVAPPGPVVLTYTAGFGATEAALPPDLRAAIMDHCAAWFDARGAAGWREGTRLSPHAARIIGRYRRVML
ncbi:MAG: hypothetical protein ACK4OP_00345 [Gemmobacter sp.]